MKKISLIFLIFISVVPVFSQTTRYYKFIEIVYEDGSKKRGNDTGMFITFTNNTCYESDEDGYIKKGTTIFGTNYTSDVYKYKGMENNIRVYLWQFSDNNNYTGYGVPDIKRYYYFSSDYTRLNIPYDASQYIPGDQKKTHVYMLTDPPSKTGAPLQLY